MSKSNISPEELAAFLAKGKAVVKVPPEARTTTDRELYLRARGREPMDDPTYLREMGFQREAVNRVRGK